MSGEVIAYHCGMCELGWLTRTKPTECPHCHTDEIETRAEAATHNHEINDVEWFDPEYDDPDIVARYQNMHNAAQRKARRFRLGGFT